MKWIYGPLFFLSHWFYARWRHGKIATVPMMRLAGIPISYKNDKKCDPVNCKNGFKDVMEQIRERFF